MTKMIADRPDPLCRHKLLLIFFLLLISCSTFYPVLNNGFTNWDDPLYITDNALVRDFSLANTGRIFTSFSSGNYHPLAILSHNLEYHLFKLNPFPYHAVNLLLHCLNALLVFWCIYLLGSNLTASFLAALLFAVHPMRVESVAWLADRKDLLSAFFLLASLLCYLRYQQRKTGVFYLLSLLLIVLSFLSKAAVLTYPFVLILCDYLAGRQDIKRRLPDKIPFFLIAFAFGLVALAARNSYQHMLQEQNYTLLSTMLVGAYRLVFYFLLKTMVPVDFGLLHPNPGLDFPPLPLIALSLLIMALLAAVLVFSTRWTRKLTFGLLFFFISLLPALSVVIIGHTADRFSYVPAIGIFFIIGEFSLFLYLGQRAKTAAAGRVVLLALLAITAIYCSLSWQQCRIWKNGVSLWSQAIKIYPDSALAYHNRGEAYLHDREYDLAIADFTRALAAGEYAVIYRNRGAAYLKKFDRERAIADYSAAIRLEPGSAEAFNFRGFAYNLKGEYENAVADYRMALGINPDYAEAYNNRAVALNALGRNQEACRDLQQACELGLCSSYAFAKNAGVCP